MFEELFEIAIWENDGGDAGSGDAGDAGSSGDSSGSGTGDSSSQQSGGGEKTFTQAEVNEYVVKRNKNLKSQYEQLEGNYESLLENFRGTDEQRAKLEDDLENVRAQMRTKEQQAAHERKREQEKYNRELTAAQEQATTWKQRYESSTIERAIVDAASKNDAFNPDHFVSLLSPKSKVVEELDDAGTPTGNLVPKVEWTVVNPDTKQPEKVLKSPSEVIELMKEDVQSHGSLFKSNVAKGLGAGTFTGGKTTGRLDVKNMTMEEYAKYAATPEGRKALGLAR